MYKKLSGFDEFLEILTKIISNNLDLTSFSCHKMLYMCVDVYDIKFRKMDKFKHLESIILENDNCKSEIKRRFKQDGVGREKDYCSNT